MRRLDRGDRLPEIVTPPPGPEARRLSERLRGVEAPGINTLLGDAPSLLWREALGANVLDVDGNVLLDLTAGFGVASIGHRHPAVVRAIRDQADALVHGLGDVHAHPRRVELAERVAALAPVPDPRVYFAVSGADAVEIALKTAVLATGRSEVIAFSPGYHGTTLGALAVTSRPAFRSPFGRQLNPEVKRLPYACPAAELERTLSTGSVGAVVVEPIVGREGVVVPPAGWLSELATRCREHGALFVVDEILTGFARTGDLFAVEREGIEPDLLCCGKALGGGLPVAAVVGRAAWMEAWRSDGEALHTATFVAHPLACAAALATLDVLETENLVERAARTGRLIEERRAQLERSAHVVEVRGRGLLWGIVLEHRTQASRLSTALLEEGILALAGGPDGNVMQLIPPLVVTDRQLDHALDAIERSLATLCPA